MVLKMSVVFLVFVFTFSPWAESHEGKKGKTKIVIRHSEFRSYPVRTTTKAKVRIAVPVHPDSFGNRVTDDHLQRVDFATQRASGIMKADSHIKDAVAFHSATYSSALHPVYQQKSLFISDQFHHYNTFIVEHPVVWENWHQHYFYGGFYYGFHPCYDINIYFYNPMVHWFYVGAWDEHFYKTWYKTEYVAYPQLHKPFEYFGVYYPTDNLRQLLFGVSGMTVEKQAQFRTSIEDFTKKLTQQLANGLKQRVVLSKGDIVVTHYEVLGYDDAVVMEGFVTHQGKAYNFKGLLSLEPSEEQQVFVATTVDAAPTGEQIQNLDSLHSAIDNIRGESATPAPAPVPTPSGEVSADPQG